MKSDWSRYRNGLSRKRDASTTQVVGTEAEHADLFAADRRACEEIVEQVACLFVFARNVAGEPPTLRKIHRLGVARCCSTSQTKTPLSTCPEATSRPRGGRPFVGQQKRRNEAASRDVPNGNLGLRCGSFEKRHLVWLRVSLVAATPPQDI